MPKLKLWFELWSSLYLPSLLPQCHQNTPFTSAFALNVAPVSPECPFHFCICPQCCPSVTRIPLSLSHQRTYPPCVQGRPQTFPGILNLTQFKTAHLHMTSGKTTILLNCFCLEPGNRAWSSVAVFTSLFTSSQGMFLNHREFVIAMRLEVHFTLLCVKEEVVPLRNSMWTHIHIHSN